MQDGGYRHLPVVEQGKVVGVVSRGDFHGLGDGPPRRGDRPVGPHLTAATRIAARRRAQDRALAPAHKGRGKQDEWAWPRVMFLEHGVH